MELLKVENGNALIGDEWVRCYDKKQAMAALGIKHPAQITQLLRDDKIVALGYTSVGESAGTTKLLLDAESVDMYAEVIRHHDSSGRRRYEIALTPDELNGAINMLLVDAANMQDKDQNKDARKTLLDSLQHAKDLTARNTQYMKSRKARLDAEHGEMPHGHLTLEA